MMLSLLHNNQSKKRKLMKHILIFSLCISTNLIGMKITNSSDFTHKTHDEIYKIMEGINKKSKLHNDDLLTYKKCLIRILPLEICKQIDQYGALLRNQIIQKYYIPRTMTQVDLYSPYQPELNISNNGNYFMHNANECTSLMDSSNWVVLSFTTNSVFFSPNNKYCIIRCLTGTKFYSFSDFCTKQRKLSNPDVLSNVVGISNDCNHFILASRENATPSIPRYNLFTINKKGLPEDIHLENNLYDAKAIAFHPDNIHIFHNKNNDTLNLYNINTRENKEIASYCDKNVNHFSHLTFNHDNTKMIARTIFHSLDKYSTQGGYMIFNIENLDNVTSITLPLQSCHEKAELPVLSIPHKKMLTHITNEGRMLILLDEEVRPVASHTAPKNSYISALAIDYTGNHIAIGHSNGTIIIWNIYNANPNQYDKVIVITNGIVKSLIFSKNQLLLSQSKWSKIPNTIKNIPLSSTLLLDVHGNTILDFGNNIVNSIMSKNGKKIITISQEKQSSGKYTSTLTAYSLRSKQIQQLYKEQKKQLTLAQMRALNELIIY